MGGLAMQRLNGWLANMFFYPANLTLSVNGVISNKEFCLGNHAEYLLKIFSRRYADGFGGVFCKGQRHSRKTL
jgi:hypothetical protein